MRRMIATLSLIGAAVFALSGTAEAACRKIDGVTFCHRGKHAGTRVKGFVQRSGGGYSYSYAESVNTYGDSGSRYPSTLNFRDPNFDRQSPGGPFDSGFFFDSGIRPRGGDSPYMN